MSCFDSLESMREVINSLPLDKQKELDEQWERYKDMNLNAASIVALVGMNMEEQRGE